MRKRLFAVLFGAALLAMALVALPDPATVASSAQDEATAREQIAQAARAQAQRAAIVAQQAAARVQEEGAVAQLVESEGDRGWLGLTIAEVTADKAKELKLPAERGVLLTEVEADSPAAKAGLKPNDVVTEYNGERMEGAAQFRRLVRETPAGRSVQLTVWREGRAQSISVQLGSFHDHFHGHVRAFTPRDFDFHFEMPEVDGRFLVSRTPTLGISAEDLSGQFGSYFGAPDGEGILVREVKAGTPAEKAGLKAGDVITKVDGERVHNVGELREKLREKREKKTVKLAVLRKGTEMSLDVAVEQPQPPERKKMISRRTYL